MKVLVRKSVAGAEYWDTEEKRSIFVPKGMNPNFEVSENPATMIKPEGGTKIISVDSSSGTDRTVMAVMKPDEGKVVVESIDLHESTEQAEPNADLESKTIKELRATAKKEGIDIPKAIRTKGDITVGPAYISQTVFGLSFFKPVEFDGFRTKPSEVIHHELYIFNSR